MHITISEGTGLPAYWNVENSVCRHNVPTHRKQPWLHVMHLKQPESLRTDALASRCLHFAGWVLGVRGELWCGLTVDEAGRVEEKYKGHVHIYRSATQFPGLDDHF